MKLLSLITFTFFSSALAQSSTADLSSLLAQWSSVAPKVTTTFAMPSEIPTRLGNVDAIPTSLMLALFEGVPQDVLMDLMDNEGRASIRSEFGAGNTPSWYLDLPTGVKSYIESINKAIATGGTPYTGTEEAPAIPNYTATPGVTGSIPPAGGNGNAQPSSLKAGAAPIQTWGAMEVLGLSGAAGILGLAVGL